MFRLIILMILAMIGYFLIKSRFLPRPKSGPREQEPPPRPAPTDSGEMVRDPVCGVYVEAQSAAFLIHEDRKLYFCSEACRQKFLEGLSAGS